MFVSVRIACLVLLCGVPFAFAQNTASPMAAPQPAASQTAAPENGVDFLVNYMEETRRDFLKSIDVTPEQWNFKPAPDRWSIAEVAEHVTLAESMLGGMIADKILTSPPAPADKLVAVKGADEKVMKMIPDRSQKAQAPEQLRPTGAFKTRQELITAFNTRRDANIQMAKTNAAELRKHVAPSPIGDFDGYQWVLFVAAHSKRHTAQIEEVKQAPNYPRQ